MSDDTAKLSSAALDNAWDGSVAWQDAWISARNAAEDAAERAVRNDAWYSARKEVPDLETNTSWPAARMAAQTEVVSDLITPEQYRLLTNPLNTGRTLQERMGLMLPDQQGPFMQMINELRPTSAEDVLAIERLGGNPNVDALLEMLAGMAEGQSLARRIKAAETMYRAGRGGRGMA